MQIYKIPVTELTKEHVYNQALAFFLYVFLGGQGRREDFMSAARQKGMNRTTAWRIWELGSYKGPHLSIVHGSGADQFCSMRSINYHNVFAYADASVIDKVIDISSFKKFMTWVQACKAYKIEGNVLTEKDYLKKNKSITLAGLARKTGMSCKQSAHRRITSAIKEFGGVATSRFRTFKGKIARLSNVYSNDLIYKRNKYSYVKHLALLDMEGVKCTQMYISDLFFKPEIINDERSWLTREEYRELYNRPFNPLYAG